MNKICVTATISRFLLKRFNLLRKEQSRGVRSSSVNCTRFLKLQTIIFHGASRIQWIPCCNGTRPPGAIEGGYDKITKSRLFVVRAHHKGGLYPGALSMAKDKATIAVYGREHQMETYEVLVAPYTSVSWVAGPPVGTTLPNSIIGGVSDAGETLFIGRAMHNGMWSVGKIHGTHGICYVPRDGNVYGYKEFEVLTQNPEDTITECD